MSPLTLFFGLFNVDFYLVRPFEIDAPGDLLPPSLVALLDPGLSALSIC